MACWSAAAVGLLLCLALLESCVRAGMTSWMARSLSDTEATSSVTRCFTSVSDVRSLPCCVARCQRLGTNCSAVIYCDDVTPFCCLQASNGTSTNVSSLGVLHASFCHEVALLPRDASSAGESDSVTAGSAQTSCLGSACVSSDTCPLANAECRDGVWKCVIGYHFNLGPGTCVATCTAYGSGYYTIPDGYLTGNNDLASLPNIDWDTCWQHCLAEPTCRTVDYWAPWCHLSTVTKIEKEADWRVDSSLGISYSQRDCA